MKNIFIVNRISGKGAAKQFIHQIEEVIEELHLDAQILVTNYPHHAEEFVRQFSPEDDVQIIAVGGDGTIFEVVNGLNEQIPLIIIPAGTGNDYFKNLMNKKSMPLKQLLVDSLQGKIVQVDIGQIHQGHQFTNVLTLGLDADVNEKVQTMMKKTVLPKATFYPLAALMEICRPHPFHVRLTLDEAEPIELDAILVAMMNGAYYGGGFHPIPEANLQDGTFDLCVVEPVSRLKLLRFLPKYAAGTLRQADIPQVHLFKAKKVELVCNQQVIAQCDGETFKTHQMAVEVLPRFLTLRVPLTSPLQ